MLSLRHTKIPQRTALVLTVSFYATFDPALSASTSCCVAMMLLPVHGLGAGCDNVELMCRSRKTVQRFENRPVFKKGASSPLTVVKQLP